MKTDIEIAQRAKLLPIEDIAAKLAIPNEALEPYGRTKAKISLEGLPAKCATAPWCSCSARRGRS